MYLFFQLDSRFFLPSRAFSLTKFIILHASWWHGNNTLSADIFFSGRITLKRGLSPSSSFLSLLFFFFWKKPEPKHFDMKPEFCEPVRILISSSGKWLLMCPTQRMLLWKDIRLRRLRSIVCKKAQNSSTLKVIQKLYHHFEKFKKATFRCLFFVLLKKIGRHFPMCICIWKVACVCYATPI